MKIVLSIRNRHLVNKVNKKNISPFIDFVLKNEWDSYCLRNNSPPLPDIVEFYIEFVTESRIKKIHLESHQDSAPTDVVSYGYIESGFGGVREFVLGEIFVSVDEAIKQSKNMKTSIEFEILLYCVHGILHIFGFDDHDEEDIKKMRERESFYLDTFKAKMDTIFS